MGKSTLTAIVAQQDHPARTLTLDDRGTRAAALDDPMGFVAGLDSAVVIDEVQRVQAAGLLNYKAVADRLQLHPDTIKSYTQIRCPMTTRGSRRRLFHGPRRPSTGW